MERKNTFVALCPPWLLCNILFYDAPYLSASHQHSEWQLTASMEGIFEFQSGEKTNRIHPGEWILIAPHVFHTAGSHSGKSSAIQIFFHYFPEIMTEPVFRQNTICTGNISLDFLQYLVEKFLCCSGAGQQFQKNWLQILPQLFLLESVSSLRFKIKESGMIVSKEMTDVLNYMEKHFSENLGVRDFAEQANLSVSRFNDLFHRTTGRSPMHYFNELRICHAQSFLLNGGSVSECAASTGFSSVPYFCRCFKQSTGQTPGAFQKNPFKRK